jgi:hypothetical protein
METDNDPGMAIHSRYYESLALVNGKEREPEKLRCACFLARRMVWHLFADPESRRILQVAEDYAWGKVDRTELHAAHKVSRRWNRVSDERTSAAECTREAMSITYAVTHPGRFSTDVLDGVVGRIIGALLHEQMASRPDSDWHPMPAVVRDQVHVNVADLIREFVCLEALQPPESNTR